MPVANRRFEIFEYRQILTRMRLGNTHRPIARVGLMGRRKAAQLRRTADAAGWLDVATPLPLHAEPSCDGRQRGAGCSTRRSPAVARAARQVPVPARANSSVSSKETPRRRRQPSRRQAVTMWTRPPVKLGAGSSDRAPLSRLDPHRFCNNDSCERQRHRLQAVPAILRHPRKFVNGTVRSIPVRSPRGNARNNRAQLFQTSHHGVCGIRRA